MEVRINCDCIELRMEELNQVQTLEKLYSAKSLLCDRQDFSIHDKVKETISIFVTKFLEKRWIEIVNNDGFVAKELECKYQGLTRPSVLIIVPVRNTAFYIIQNFIKISRLAIHDNKKRFIQEFGTVEQNEIRKPEDYKLIFKGNIDDCFKLVIKIGRKSTKIYSGFYDSDIIVASPLGLKMTVR